MADELGAVRRTPRPTGDRQTPETGPQESAGTTNTASPVSGDQPAVSSRVSSQGEPAFQAATLAVLEALNPMGDDPVYPTRSTEFAAYVAEQVEQALIGAGWRRPRPDHEAALAALRAAILENPESISFAGPECDMEAYAALPLCTACEGGGQDTHGTVFEAPLAVHFAGPPIRAERRHRQLCMWCGHVLVDITRGVDERFPDVDSGDWPIWPVGALVRVEDGLATRVSHTDGGELPPGCCALPDEGEPVCICSVESARCPDCRDEDQADDEDEPTCPICKATELCDHCADDGWTHVGPKRTDDGPDEAQETRAAADWPAEPVDVVEAARRQGVDLYEETAGYHPNTGEPHDPVVRGG